MDAETALRIGREALLLTVLLSAIPVLSALVVGLLVSVFQAATQIQEQTLPVVPKLVAVYAALAMGGLWILQELARFTAALFSSIGNVGR